MSKASSGISRAVKRGTGKKDSGHQLAIINSVQQGLASKLDMQAIYDLVGDKVRDIFKTEVVYIAVRKPDQPDFIDFPYYTDRGKRLQEEALALGDGITSKVIFSKQPLVANSTQEQLDLGAIFPQGEESQSYLGVPILVGDFVAGVVSVQSYEKHAFSESDIRLLSTLASSMGVALENARLFDETQRLLKITEDRAAELAIINSVQAGLVAKMDMQGIYDLVGDRVRDIFDAQVVIITRLDRQANLNHIRYAIERGQRVPPFSAPPAQGVLQYFDETHQPLLINKDTDQIGPQYGMYIVKGTESPKSILAIPLLIGDEIKGTISLQNLDRENAFSDSDVRLLQTLANSMSVALENARLFDETQRLLKITEERNAELAIINSVQAALAAELNIQGIYDAVGDKIREIFHQADMGILVYDPQTNTVHYPYTYENGERINIDSRPLSEKGFAAHVIRTRETVVINENIIQEMENYGSSVLPGSEIQKSMVMVPLVAGDHSRGVIDIVDMQREHAFTESDVRLLQTLANSMSVALENAHLFDETQRLFKAEQERVAELQIINSIQQGLAAELDFQAIVDLIGDKLREVLNTRDIGINWYDEETNLIHYLYYYEHGKRISISSRPPTPGGMFEMVATTRQPVIINTAEYLARTGAEVIPGTDVSKSMASVPIISSDRVLGNITIENYERESAFGESELRLLTTIAASLGTALENARLFDETQRLLKETEQRNAELAIINSIGQTLTERLDLNTMVERVGDKLHEALNVKNIGIGIYNEKENIMQVPYAYRAGKRLSIQPFPLNVFNRRASKVGRSIVVNKDAEKFWLKFGGISAGDEIPRSFVMVPLMAGKELVGGISLQDFEQENAFENVSIGLLESVASNMGTAILNVRLFEETQRLLKQTEQRAAELAIINSVQQGLASKLDMQAIYDLVGNKVCEIFNLQTCYIMLYDKEKELEYYPFAVDDGIRLKQEPIAHDEHGFGPLVMRTRQPLMINENMGERAVQVGSYALSGGIVPKSAIYVPLLIGDEAKGVISVQNTQQEHAFTESDLRLLITLASSMSVALESVRLFAETEQRATELTIINTVQEGLASKLDVQAIYDLVGETLRELFDTQSINLAAFDLEKNTRHYYYLFEKGKRFEVPDAPIAPMSQYIIRTHQPLLINEDLIESLAEIGIASQTVPGTQPTRSLVRVPILIGGQVRGVIGLDNLDRENAFTTSDLRLLQTLASSLSVALENARLFEETKRNATELSTVNTISSALASELDVDHLIQLVGEQIRTTFKADIAYVALWDEVTNDINFPYTYGEELSPMRYGEGLTGKIIQTGRPLLLNSDMDRQTQQIGASIVGIQSLSYLGVPILVGGKAVGVISIQSTSQEGAFDENDQRLMNTIAANVGSALHNARLYKEAQESRASAERANRAKSTFLANMSHELRTPLNAIIGFTRIVKKKSDGLLPAKQLENLDKVLTSSEHLLGLINTVLDIAKIEAGRMDVIPGNFSISALADQCANLATPLLKPNVNLEKHVDVNLGIIYSDQDKIKQVVLNLLSNAAKFTHKGAISLRVEKCDENTMRIAVADSGIGISEEALTRIFDEFQQADTSTTRQYGGTGLGLAISRNLARLLGGDLTATSELGKGSTFSLTIPIYYGRKATTRQDTSTPYGTGSKSEPVQQAETDSHAEAAKKRVLVIDDDPDAAYLLQESLNQNEFAVIGAPNGHAGLQLARDTQPDAILLDILMPETDGWQVLNDLKMDKATVDIPVILLTIVDKKALGFKLGAAAYLLKPLNPIVVLEALRRVIGEKEHPHKHILVVDDDPNVAEMLRQTLQESDFVLMSAEDGEAGLKAIEVQRPDVILLDLMMPKLDGFGVIERLRTDPDLRNIPIIVISAKELTEAESQTLKESVAFVMKKQGFNSDRLMQEINSVVKK